MAATAHVEIMMKAVVARKMAIPGRKVSFKRQRIVEDDLGRVGIIVVPRDPVLKESGELSLLTVLRVKRRLCWGRKQMSHHINLLGVNVWVYTPGFMTDLANIHLCARERGREKPEIGS